MDIDRKQLDTIFLVDDEPASLRLLEQVLSRAGYRNLVSINDPLQVVDAYRKHQPDLIFLDIRMPHMSGFQVMDALRELKEPLLPPVIFLASDNDRGNLVMALDKGGRDLLQKPFFHAELLMKVQNMLEVHFSHRVMHRKNRLLEDLVNERTRQLRESRLKIVERLGIAAEYRDNETSNHNKRMSHLCELLAARAGWSQARCTELRYASLLHDIGKLGVPDAILLKPGKLTPDEFELMKSHTIIGRNILDGDDSSLMQMARDVAYTHHEKWDGSGYPRGIAGDDIPLAGRIAAIADVFDALGSNRPYKKAWELGRILELMRRERGAHFDPVLVDILIDNIDAVCRINSEFSDAAAGRCDGDKASGRLCR